MTNPVQSLAEIRSAIDDYRRALTSGDRMTRDIRAGHARMVLEALIERAIQAAAKQRAGEA